MELREAANKTGSSDQYDKLCERCNSEISKLILGNTLTTEADVYKRQGLLLVLRAGELLQARQRALDLETGLDHLCAAVTLRKIG